MSAKSQSILAEAAAASVGGAISASVLYPLEVLKTKMQAVESSDAPAEPSSGDSNAGSEDTTTSASYEKIAEDAEDQDSSKPKKNLSAIEFTKEMYKDGGVAVFYDGIGTSAFQSACEKALYFFAYTYFKNFYKGIKGGAIGTTENLILGGMAEWAHLPITLPIDCLTTKIQTSKTNDNPYRIMMAMFSEKGLSGMYKGWEAYTVLCLKPAIQYTVYEQIKGIMLRRRKAAPKGSRGRGKSANTLSAAESFLLGMVARAISTTLVFPYTRAKVMLQANKKNDGSDETTSIPQMLTKMYNEQGFQSLFIGLGPELTRGVLSTAFMLMIKEQIGSFMEVLLS
uniref:ADP,ATP carrier protein n=2 Tax=Leptocylindrus danicus TaxID=163516 RepID=A0A7S2P208_9STRA